MKRQLGAMLVAGLFTLSCASLAWSQSGGEGSSQGGAASSQSGDTGSSQGGGAGAPPAGGTQLGASGPSQTGFTSSSQTLFTSPTLWTEASPSPQSGDPQSGSGGTGSDSSQTGAIGPQETFKHPEQLPGLDVFSDTISHTGLAISTSAGSLAEYSTNSGYPGYWQNLSSVGAGISLVQARPGLSWLLSYDGGLNVTTGGSSYGSYSNLNQDANAQITWNFAKRWQMHFKDTYFYSDDPFQPFLTFLGTPTPNNPYPVTYYPQAIIEQNQAHLDLTYQLSPHDLINFTGAESFNRYLRQSATSLYNSVSYSGGVFYQHAFSARLAAGGGYQFAALDFGHGQSRAGVQNFEGFIEYSFSSRLTASLWIGPELTNTKDIVPVFCYQFGCFVEALHQSSWSVAEGGTLDYQITPKDHFSFQGSRGVSNAGGFLGAANIYQAVAAYGRPINHVWNLGVAANYANTTSVSQFRSKQYLKSITGTVGVTRRLFNSDAWNLNAYYAFIHQKQNYYGFPDTVGTNGFGFTIRYTWDHGFGR